VLNSYHKGYLWTDEITRGVEDSFLSEKVNLHLEYLDTKQFFDEMYFELLYDLLEYKHKLKNFDAIIISDNNSFNFYLEKGNSLFGDTPVVFCGLNYFSEDDIKGLSNITGVNERADLESNIKLIESIHENIQKILIITDDTTTGRKIQEEVLRIDGERSSEAVDLELIYNVSSEELENRLQTLEADTVVYLTVFSRDKDGVYFEYDQFTKQISRASTVPVYGAWNFQIGNGIFGGYLVDGYSQGVSASKMVIDILKGTPVASIAVQYDTPTKLKFDYIQLERFGIDLSIIPEKAILINREDSFYSQYKLRILFIASIFLFLVFALLGVFYGYIKSVKAEKEIRFQKESLRTTLYSIGDAVVSTDLQQRVVTMNPNAEVLTGWNNSDATGKPINDVFRIFQVDDNNPMENPVAKVLETGRIQGLPRHSTLIARDGREFIISDSAAPICDDNGGLTGVVLVFRNVSDEYEIQEQLISERNYVKRIINNAPSLICGLDENGYTTFINPVVEKITGYSEEEIIGQNFWKLLYPEEEIFHVNNLLSETVEGAVIDYEMILTCKDGSKKNIVWNSFSKKDDDGKVLGFLGFGYDITEQKKIKEALLISKKRLRTIIDMVPSSIFVKDSKGVFLALNKMASENMGLDIRDLIGRSMQEVYPEKHMVEEMLEQDRQVLKNGQQFVIAEERHATKSGEVFWQKTVKIRCPEELFGEPAILGIATDITDLKAAEKRLSEANQELIKHKNHLEELVADRTLELQISLDHLQEAQKKLGEAEKMAALGGLVAGVAHEVNTPVGIGVTAASHLEESVENFKVLYHSGNATKSDFEKFMDVCSKSSIMILSNMNRAADLIQSFKQVAVDQSSQECRKFDVKKYMDEILLSLHAHLRKSKYDIQINCPEELEIYSCPGALSQIITNLIMNSLNHGFENSDEGSVMIDIRERDRNVLIIFGDTGCGISNENLGRIFEPFFTTKRGVGGSGLGMNIVYNLVTQTLKGQISCTSKIGQGTWFEIEFPADLATQ